MTYREFSIGCLAIFLMAMSLASASANASSVISGAGKDRSTGFSDHVGGQSVSKPRLIVLTDMTSIETDVLEPDDAQSMIRLMLYANEFDIEGLIASSGLQHGYVVRPQYIRRIVSAYGKVQPNLILHDPDYPSAEQLAGVIKSGQPMADRGMPVSKSIGRGKDTPASQWIIKMADKPDSRPLWITAWGGTADVAQALWKVKNTRSCEELRKFIEKLRIVASSDQDSTTHWITSQFPDLFYVTRKEGGRGMYRGGDAALASSDWVQRNIKGHGALGDMYPDYRGGDNYSAKLGKVKGIKSGDSATFMGLIHNGLNRPGHLTWANWGGRIEADADNPNHFHDAIDPVGQYQDDYAPYWASVYRWRPDFQADYAARFDWCVQSYDQANHAPEGDERVTEIPHVVSGRKIILRSGNWRDPDGDDLKFRWQILKAESTYSTAAQVERKHSRLDDWWQFVRNLWAGDDPKDRGKTLSGIAQLNAPQVTLPQSVHVLLTVTDDGEPALSSYKRFMITVHPASE